ncbi:hypothetical protein C8J57DRAFT_1232169 [Mycena rebaudengoi]|nr:hypothetical protein C8J57DRAFT_1232169 [Mycena rebaudengoi]
MVDFVRTPALELPIKISKRRAVDVTTVLSLEHFWNQASFLESHRHFGLSRYALYGACFANCKEKYRISESVRVERDRELGQAGCAECSFTPNQCRLDFKLRTDCLRYRNYRLTQDCIERLVGHRLRSTLLTIEVTMPVELQTEYNPTVLDFNRWIHAFTPEPFKMSNLSPFNSSSRDDANRIEDSTQIGYIKCPNFALQRL